MPIHMRLPKRGFNNPSRLRYAEVNLDAVQAAVDSLGKLDTSAAVGRRGAEDCRGDPPCP